MRSRLRGTDDLDKIIILSYLQHAYRNTKQSRSGVPTRLAQMSSKFSSRASARCTGNGAHTLEHFNARASHKEDTNAQ